MPYAILAIASFIAGGLTFGGLTQLTNRVLLIGLVGGAAYYVLKVNK
ncbi:hypothetical Protein YC6258_03773 [Gynuella sunshinyii YC6258]|uniref:Uncharacterized protein n=1 Tax=Gynuella sunshinyii YC6258 TaxID=1445510 RepID=A0A0C5VZH1_9GAMM|nr:hypothetical Protein YC6258_00192 [Gynuella sunshinyii YC6258]AJQ95809.1 hypothetical Protein YC6258_03773 [Gynuella sunshinyii YC6258]